ncbi:MAG TPA: RNA 2',3'-cyclic phosphodiesterase [Solirubrobacteraceae bacterium]
MSALGGSRPERARLFAALELPTGVCEALVSWRSMELPRNGGLRMIAPEHLHVTLCFLGWRPVDDVRGILDACRTVSGQRAAELSLRDAVWLPRRRPRVLAVELEDPAGRLSVVQSELSEALAAGGWYAPEKRPFLAHVTVARVGGGSRLAPFELSPPPSLRFEGSRVTLYRSRLGGGGARYEPLGTVELQ